MINFFSIFQLLPQVLKNIIASFYGLIQKRRRYGGIFSILSDEFIRNENVSREQMRKKTLKNLEKILIHCAENVPYYKKHLNASEIIKSQSPMDILQSLPVLKKNEVRLKNDQFINTKALNNRNLKFHYTSGSTGSPLKVYTLPENDQFNFALGSRLLSFANAGFQDKKVMFGGKPIMAMNKKKPPFWVTNYFESQLYCSSYHMSYENLEYYHSKIIKFQPSFLIGYASSITVYAKYLKSLNTKYNGKSLLGIFPSSETLLHEDKLIIEEVFKCKVHDGYSLAEYVNFVAECEEGNYHISPEAGIIEILDDNGMPLKNGQIGNIVCTTLFNTTMPLIRYDTGDIGSKHESDFYCSCGRKTAILRKIIGRSMSYLNLNNNKKIGAAGLTTGFLSNEIIESQFIQHNIDSVLLKLVVTDKFTEADKKILIKEMRNRLSPLILKIKFVKSISRSKNGKKEFIINSMNRNQN